jgi:L-aminopeptidase/D-esterase-like protein
VGVESSGSSDGALTDVPGIRVGHWTDREAGTGCTVVLCERGATAGVDVRGAAPGTRETDLLRPASLVEEVHAVLLSGGSAFGLDAAGGVMCYLEERGIGFRTPAGPVPIVPAAVLFDLGLGRADVRPDAAAGYAACLAASTTVAEGSLGAGTGATVAKAAGLAGAVKGGIGTASRVLPGGAIIAALVAVNSVGSVHDPATGAVLAGPRAAGGSGPLVFAGANTTLAVVATTAALGKAAANRLATVAHDGLALAIRPAHTAYDGDTVFALSLPPTDGAPPVQPVILDAAAGEVVAAAIVRAVRLAAGLHGVPAASEGFSPSPARAER